MTLQVTALATNSKKWPFLGMVLHTCYPSSWRQKQEDHRRLQASVVCRVNHCLKKCGGAFIKYERKNINFDLWV